MSHNHWSIFLILEGENDSVRLNMTAKSGYINGDLEVTDHNYVLTNSRITYFNFGVNPNVTVNHMLGLIYLYRRHNYNMSGGGSGCRYWVYTIMSDFANANFLVDTQAGQTIWPHLLYQYSLHALPTPLDMVYGEFVNGEEEEDEEDGEEEEEDEEDEEDEE